MGPADPGVAKPFGMKLACPAAHALKQAHTAVDMRSRMHSRTARSTGMKRVPVLAGRCGFLDPDWLVSGLRAHARTHEDWR